MGFLAYFKAVFLYYEVQTSCKEVFNGEKFISDVCFVFRVEEIHVHVNLYSKKVHVWDFLPI